MSRSVELLLVPWDSGHRGERMGRGPEHLVAHGLEARVGSTSTAVIDDEDGLPTELRTSFALQRRLAERAHQTLSREAFPLIAAGTCGVAIGAVAGILAERDAPVGVVWFDAHADFNTPETDTGGFLDGQGLAILTGRCWKPLAGSIPGFRPVPDEHVVLVGARAIDPDEEPLLAASGIERVLAEGFRSEGARALDGAIRRLAERAERGYVHVDLDVHDPHVAQANPWSLHPSARGGPLPDQVRAAVHLIADRLPVAAATITAYDPSVDPEDRTLDIALALAAAMAQAARPVSGSRAATPPPDQGA